MSTAKVQLQTPLQKTLQQSHLKWGCSRKLKQWGQVFVQFIQKQLRPVRKHLPLGQWQPSS